MKREKIDLPKTGLMSLLAHTAYMLRVIVDLVFCPPFFMLNKSNIVPVVITLINL